MKNKPKIAAVIVRQERIFARDDRAIQYAATWRINVSGAEYWITRFRG